MRRQDSANQDILLEITKSHLTINQINSLTQIIQQNALVFQTLINFTNKF
jgi:hypothetical protein